LRVCLSGQVFVNYGGQDTERKPHKLKIFLPPRRPGGQNDWFHYVILTDLYGRGKVPNGKNKDIVI